MRRWVLPHFTLILMLPADDSRRRGTRSPRRAMRPPSGPSSRSTSTPGRPGTRRPSSRCSPRTPTSSSRTGRGGGVGMRWCGGCSNRRGGTRPGGASPWSRCGSSRPRWRWSMAATSRRGRRRQGPGDVDGDHVETSRRRLADRGDPEHAALRSAARMKPRSSDRCGRGRDPHEPDDTPARPRRCLGSRDTAPDVFDNAIDPRWTAEFLADPRDHLAVAIINDQVVGIPRRSAAPLGRGDHQRPGCRDGVGHAPRSSTVGEAIRESPRIAREHPPGGPRL